MVAIIYCNEHARSSLEQESEVWETQSRVLRVSKKQDMRGNGGLGFSTDAAPPWVASALFWKDKAGPRPSPSAWEQVLKGEQEDRRNT